MIMKKHIEPDAFIAPALTDLEIDTRDEALFRKFVERNVGKLDELWAVFLEEEAYDRLMARTPSLRTLIHTTSPPGSRTPWRGTTWRPSASRRSTPPARSGSSAASATASWLRLRSTWPPSGSPYRREGPDWALTHDRIRRF